MTIQVGDMVKIEPLSMEQKRNYPTGWVHQNEDLDDNMDLYIGEITKVIATRGHGVYLLEYDDEGYEWSDVNLTLINPSKMVLF